METYKQYVDNWLKENPPFSGPYLDKCLSKKEWKAKQKKKSFVGTIITSYSGFLGYKNKK